MPKQLGWAEERVNLEVARRVHSKNYSKILIFSKGIRVLVGNEAILRLKESFFNFLGSFVSSSPDEKKKKKKKKKKKTNEKRKIPPLRSRAFFTETGFAISKFLPVASCPQFLNVLFLFLCLSKVLERARVCVRERSCN